MALGTATFYKCTDDPRVANKTVTAISGGTTGIIKPLEPLSNLDARLVVNYKQDCMFADYFSISDNGNTLYYKITNRERGLAGEMIITGTLDSVKTYWGTLKDCSATCARNETIYNSQFVDPKYMMYQNREVETKKLGNFSNFGDYKIIICYNGTLPKSGGVSERGFTPGVDGSWINPW